MRALEETFHRNGMTRIAGVDEAGRGPLAGPVVASAVILPPEITHDSSSRIRDSKSLTPRMREKKYWEILSVARAGVGIVSEQLIDEINILQASLLAMRRAILSLSCTPDAILIDGLHRVPDLSGIEQVAIVDGDLKSLSIAAASIIAKVTRDKIMEAYDQTFPQYGFSKHKGYPTSLHLASLERFGPSVIHRMSFRPVSKKLEESL